MTTSPATAAPDPPTPSGSPAPPHRSVRTAVLAVLVVGAVLGLAAAGPGASGLLGACAAVGLIVVMAGVPVLLEMEDRARGR